MDSDMIYNFPCTSCKENGMNSESVSYCESCKKHFCTICVKMHDRILKEHHVLDKSRQHLWPKETEGDHNTIASAKGDNTQDTGRKLDLDNRKSTQVGRRFSFGEGFIYTRCCSREDAKLANAYMNKRFVDGQPTTRNPDPLPALPYNHTTPVRR
ncbi:hypothetical protein MAR_003419, partial [Mya arenaria]